MNYFVKIESLAHKNHVTTVLLPGGQTVELDMALGKYTVKYAAGYEWIDKDRHFGPETRYSKATRIFSFHREGEQIQGWTITLYTVPNGNLPTVTIDASQF
jgi:hypothetical protein